MVLIPPLGVSPLGTFGETLMAPMPPPPVIQAEAVDPRTGELLSVLGGVHPVDAQVVEALSRVRLSGSCVINVGSRFDTVRKLTEDAPRSIELLARSALQALVKQGDISITSITLDTGSDWAEVTVNYDNLRRYKDQRQRAQVAFKLGAAQ